MRMPARAPTINPKDVVEGLGKGLRVIEAFDDDHVSLTASETAQLRISANVTSDFGSVTASEPMLCCAGKIVGTMSS
jgi:hypothetical protein